MKLGDFFKEDYIRSSIEHLKKRWNDEKRLLKSAARRWHLHYKKLTFGKKQGRIVNILKLLHQLHDTYYLGHFEATVSLAGSLLEQALIYKLEKLIEKEELYNMGLHELINLCYKNKIFNNGEIAKLCTNIRKIRNCSVHQELPCFIKNGEDFILELSYEKSEKTADKLIIKLDKNEVDELSQNLEELTPYYCITRIREILHDLFENN